MRIEKNDLIEYLKERAKDARYWDERDGEPFFNRILFCTMLRQEYGLGLAQAVELSKKIIPMREWK